MSASPEAGGLTPLRPIKLSVIIPAFNESGTIEEILTRVRAVPYDTEIIVVDDGSTDDSADVAARYGERLTLVRQENGAHKAAQEIESLL